ncbi:hypothetical protein IE53DRAFT_256429 [Violaceomyces palustris]|uniref:Uncharacterized protein n=1 Tax=Violaceomyces palustris TaxID=1673888 RepID=A0ACD0NNG2_9BASI|nr:hypothetical protein IE53DRAFT_256429 [Violaceomyces palustris]
MAQIGKGERYRKRVESGIYCMLVGGLKGRDRLGDGGKESAGRGGSRRREGLLDMMVGMIMVGVVVVVGGGVGKLGDLTDHPSSETGDYCYSCTYVQGRNKERKRREKTISERGPVKKTLDGWGGSAIL